MSRIMEALRNLHEKHERLKHTVHTAWRYPLPKWGQFAMGCFYFSIPVVGGWHIMQWAISKSHEEIGERGEKLQRKQLEGIGNKINVDGREEILGAGGRYGGVHLAVSDSSVKEKNRMMLEAMFEKEKRRRGQTAEREAKQ